MDAATIRAAVDAYEALGFDTLPVRPDSKRCMMHGWPRRSSVSMWRNAPGDSLIGLRAGGEIGAAFVDCDAPETFDAARRWLAGLGFMPDGDYPVIRSASGDGRHIYTRLDGSMPGHIRKLAPDFGAGEFRYGPGSLVVAPPSELDGGRYELLAGDLRQLPRLEVADVLPILGNQSTTGALTTTSLPIPARARALLAGDGVGAYPTRSEAEEAMIAALVNAGHDFGSVLALFLSHPAAGKFAELRRKSEADALTWLRRSYDAAKAFADAHPSEGRRIAMTALQWADSRPWPGRTGSSDRALFVAHCTIAQRAGVVTYAASTRRLAELGGLSHRTALKANHRLIAQGLILREKRSLAELAGLYRLPADSHSCTTYSQYYCEEVVNLCESTPRVEADCFRWAGLGKSAAECFAALQEGSATAAELAERTGRHLATVHRALSRMSRLIDQETGEVLRLCERDGDGWRVVDGVDLAQAARCVGTAGAGERQRRQHEEDRRGWARALARGRERKATEDDEHL